MSSILSKGKDVTEAINLALEILDTTREEIDIEIIDPGKKKAFGLGNKPAVVKVTKLSKVSMSLETKQTKTKEPETKELVKNQIETLQAELDLKSIFDETTLFDGITIDDDTIDPAQHSTDPFIQDRKIDIESLNGKVWVKDGIIQCKDDERSFPIIVIPDDISAYLNEQQVFGSILIKEKDSIRVLVENIVQDTAWEIEVDAKGTQALLRVTPGFTRYRSLEDQEPARKITFSIAESVEVKNTLKKNDILDELKQMGIVYGINYIELELACHATEPSVFQIAKALLPTEGTNGQFVGRINVNEYKHQPQERSDGTVDFRESQQISIVEEGFVIGDVIPPVPGKPGINVKGEPLEPAPVFPIYLRPDKSVFYLEAEGQVIATESGRPKIDKQGLMVHVSVVPKLYHSGDVDLSTGNIRFIGDVEINGSVEENMIVEAEGDLFIHESVNNAKLSSGQSLYIKQNLIASEVTAGKSNLVLSELAQMIGELKDKLQTIIFAIEQLYETPSFKKSDFSVMGLSSLLRILMERKFNSFLPQVKKLITTINLAREFLGQEWIELSERCQKTFLFIHPDIVRSTEDLQELYRSMDDLYHISIVPTQEHVSVSANYALNCRIYSSGDISIIQGCYNSNLHAGGMLHVKGYVLGGTIFAGGGANIAEVGSKAGIKTKIIVPVNQSIVIGAAMEDTVIQIGKRIYQFPITTYNVSAKIDKQGEILIHS